MSEKFEQIEKITNKILQGDALQWLKKIPSNSIDMVITSPPYYGLRFYGEEKKTIWGGNKKCQHQWVEAGMPIETNKAGNKEISPSNIGYDGVFVRKRNKLKILNILFLMKKNLYQNLLISVKNVELGMDNWGWN